MLNLVIGVIIENFSNQTIGNLSMEEIEGFRDAWLLFDPYGTYQMRLDQLPLLLQKVDAPLGLHDMHSPTTRSVRMLVEN